MGARPQSPAGVAWAWQDKLTLNGWQSVLDYLEADR
jgi:hypothetical protein